MLEGGPPEIQYTLKDIFTRTFVTCLVHHKHNHPVDQFWKNEQDRAFLVSET